MPRKTRYKAQRPREYKRAIARVAAAVVQGTGGATWRRRLSTLAAALLPREEEYTQEGVEKEIHGFFAEHFEAIAWRCSSVASCRQLRSAAAHGLRAVQDARVA